MKNSHLKYLLIVLLIISILSIGYAAFTVDLNIDSISALFRLQTDIRITNITVENKTDDTISNYEDYNVKSISSELELPTNESSITYGIDVTNLGGTYMVIAKVNGLPTDLEYSFDNYELNNIICDDNNECNLGITKKLYLTIKPKSTRNVENIEKYNINLEFEFVEFSYTINYILGEREIELIEDLTYENSVNDSISLTDGVYTINKSGNYTGLYISSDHLKDGKTYILSYKLQKLSGTLQNIGGESENAIEKAFIIDELPSLYPYQEPITNLIDDTEEHTIEFKFEYDADATSTSNNKNVYIQVNKTEGTPVPVEVKIYDIHLYEVNQEDSYHMDEEINILSSAKKTGYVFTGWNRLPDGTGASFDKQSNIMSVIKINGTQLNVYAQWNRKPYAGYPIYHMVEEFAVPGNQISEFVSKPTGIDFSKSAGNTNGKGVYIYNGTEDDTYPTYFYRGEVENNNVIFGNYCWKIVRTTETGGTKLFYNGVPTDGTCNNTGNASQIASKIKYNSIGTMEAIGYSYGKTHKLTYKIIPNIPTGAVFSNDVIYENGKYEFINNDESDIYLKDDNMASDPEGVLKNHHYTCFKTAEEECTSMYFVFMVRGTTIYYIVLHAGEKIEDAINNGLTNSPNTTSSTVKTYIDNWYTTNMTKYTQYLEDTAWCNDRSISSAIGWTKEGELFDDAVYKMNFSGYKRNYEDKQPSLNCANPSDRFTVDPQNGNGALTYPVALLTMDETALAGYVWHVTSNNNYLNNDKIWWTMTPTLISVGNGYLGVNYSILDNVHAAYTSNDSGGVRPSISLKYGTKIKSGYGTIDEPFIIDENTYTSANEIYDPNNEVEEMLHIGDFVNYDAGTWTKSEIDSIKVGPVTAPVSANNSLNLPTTDYQFGGFTAGTSRNSTSQIALFTSLGEVKYINNATTNEPITGWRVFDINQSTGEVTLISAGNPEAFYQTNASGAGYSTPYIFSGTIHSSWGEENAKKFLKRDWSPYINQNQGATSAYILSKENLETWYSKHISSTGDLWTISNFQKIYSNSRLHNIIDNYSFWWLSSTRAPEGPHFVQGDSARRLRGGNAVALGIRINIVLSNTAKFSSTRVGTIELTSEHLTDYGGNQVYNVWDLETNIP